MNSRRRLPSKGRDAKSSSAKEAPKTSHARRANETSGAHEGIASLAKHAGNAALDRLVNTQDAEQRGAAVEPDIASKLGGAYGVDLHEVRIVDEPQAHAAASALGAQAFAADRTVYIGDQAPAPETAERDALIAHELAHVAQQERASTLEYGRVNAAGDGHERAADLAASSALAGVSAPLSAPGSPAAVQRQPLGVTKKAGTSRAEAQKILEGYFSRVPQPPNSRGLTLTADIKRDLRKLETNINDAMISLQFDAFLSSNILPTTPADLAARVAAMLPETIQPAALAHLNDSEYDPLPPEPESTRFGRLGDLAKKTAPEVGADAQEQGWKFDQNTSQVRDKDKPVLGPLKTFIPSIDIERLVNIGKGLPKAWKGDKKETKARSYPAVDAAVATIPSTSLIPKAARGTKQADSFANAQYLAASLARDLDIAQQKKQYTVTLNIGDNYRSVDDRAEMLDEAERIVHVVEQALPHHASKVGQVEIWIGKMRVRVVKLGGAE